MKPLIEIINTDNEPNIIEQILTNKPMQQQTAVDIFFFEIKRYNIGNNQYLINKEDLEKLELQAKEMEKDKMENLWDAAISHGGCKCYDEIMTFEEYYNETFNK